MPPLLYGTAWKEDRTEALVARALEAGFRGIDTANQRKHYHEAGVGAALRQALADGSLRRDELFVQTKFTFQAGQDHRLPYDPTAAIGRQVEQSLTSSLEHLGLEHVDALVLHGPSGRRGLAEADREAWNAMADLARQGIVRAIGVSNVSAEQLAELHRGSSAKPSVVQNRTLVYPGADGATRAFCRDNGIRYQGFSLLTAAPALLRHPVVHAAASRLHATPAQVVLGFWMGHGVVVLTGTTSEAHMQDDLEARDLALEPDETAAIAALLGMD